MKNNFEFLTGRENEFLIEYEGYLIHKDILSSFQKLQKKAKEEIGANLKIISSFRNFERQLAIWNGKATGTRPVKNVEGDIIDTNNVNEEILLNAIMKFSAIPGASRHHWGTDIDIYDANVLEKEKVCLEPSECTEGGPFYKLHSWLDEKVENGKAYDFFRPYDKDLGGVAQEKWHLSYSPLSNQFFDDYSYDVFLRNLEESDLILKNLLLERSESIFEKYIRNISF